jgi:hypothetical protein
MKRSKYKPATSTSKLGGRESLTRYGGVMRAGLELARMVRVVVRTPFEGRVPFGGLKVQERPAGRPGQLKLNTSVRPFCEVTETLKFAEEPTGMVAEVGERLPVAF